MNKAVILTNNPLAAKKLMGRFQIEFIHGTARSVLLMVRDMVYRGHGLLTHPMPGSVKPNDTPYKSVAVSGERGETDLLGAEIISKSIELFDRFSFRNTEYDDTLLGDFMLIDYTLISSGIDGA